MLSQNLHLTFTITGQLRSYAVLQLLEISHQTALEFVYIPVIFIKYW